MNISITDRAMVANLSISLWQGYRVDKAASQRVTRDAGAASDAARVNKHLVPKEALAPIVTAANDVRTHFYTNTLPWRDNGDRLLTRMLYTKFIDEHERLAATFKNVVDAFLDKGYPAAREQAQFRMGEMFNPNDYPSAFELQFKFRVGLSFDAVTTANDFRVQIDQGHVDRIRQQMEEAADQRIKAAMADVWTRAAEVVGRLAERMQTPDAVFRNTTITGVQDLVDMLPGLNLVGDPEIDKLQARLQRLIGGVDAGDVRKDPALRTALGSGAQQVLDDMAGILKAFGGGHA